MENFQIEFVSDGSSDSDLLGLDLAELVFSPSSEEDLSFH
jgi:hypothetical protein